MAIWLSIAMGQDGSIFLIRLKDDVVVRYDPDTGTSEDIVTYSLRSFTTILLNSMARIFLLTGAGTYGSAITLGSISGIGLWKAIQLCIKSFVRLCS